MEYILRDRLEPSHNQAAIIAMATDSVSSVRYALIPKLVS